MKSKNMKLAEMKDSAAQNLLDVLHQDHMKVDDLFFQFSRCEEESEKQELVNQIITELTLHAKAEEEIVYPEVRDGKESSEDLMDEADTEHHVVKFLIAELKGMKPSDDHFDSKVTVLSEIVKHHVKEEESEIFEKLKGAEVDLEKLATEFSERKMELAQKPLPEDSFPVIGKKQERKSA